MDATIWEARQSGKTGEPPEETRSSGSFYRLPSQDRHGPCKDKTLMHLSRFTVPLQHFPTDRRHDACASRLQSRARDLGEAERGSFGLITAREGRKPSPWALWGFM